MKGKLYPSILISIFFHGLFIIFLLFGIKNSIHDSRNFTYLTLIYETNNTDLTPSSTEFKEKIKTPTQKPAIKEKPKISEKANKKTNITSKADEKILQERLAALRAKKRIEGSLEVAGSGNLKKQEVSPSYLGLISGLIRQNWSIPETLPENLEAIVSVRILANGQVIIEGFEKRSGNVLFDSSVIKALKNSSPLPPPMKEVIIGLRFKP